MHSTERERKRENRERWVPLSVLGRAIWNLRLGYRSSLWCTVPGVFRCGGCVHILYWQSVRILKRQTHIGVQRQTLFTELFLSVALKYIPPGSNSQNVWDAGLMVSSGRDRIVLGKTNTNVRVTCTCCILCSTPTPYSGSFGFRPALRLATTPEDCRDFPLSLQTIGRIVLWIVPLAVSSTPFRMHYPISSNHLAL